MIDCYEYDRSNQWPDVYGGAKHVFCNRSEGDDATVQRIADLLAPHWEHSDPWEALSNARQVILAQAYPPGAVLTGLEPTTAESGLNSPEIFYRCTFTVPTPTTKP